MKAPWLLSLIALPLAVACGTPEPRDDGAGGSVTADAVEEVVYVDVRTPAEHAGGHVEGAIHIPHDEMERRWRELEPYRDRTLVVYCRTGRRSGLAIDVLRAKGFEHLVNGGGLRDLEARGVTIER